MSQANNLFMESKSMMLSNYVEYLSTKLNGDPAEIQQIAIDLLEIYAKNHRQGQITLKPTAGRTSKPRSVKGLTETESAANARSGRAPNAWNCFVSFMKTVEGVKDAPARQLVVTPTMGRTGMCTGRGHAASMVDFPWGQPVIFGDLIDAGLAAKLSGAKLSSMLWFVLNDEERLQVRQPVPEASASAAEPTEFEEHED